MAKNILIDHRRATLRNTLPRHTAQLGSPPHSATPRNEIQRAVVPCNDCKECCTDTVLLLPHEGDDISQYDHVMLPGPGPDHAVALRRKPNGECVYLGPQGCTIHDRAPYLCKTFDCRLFFLNRTRAERHNLVKRGLAKKEIFQAARRLLEQETKKGDAPIRSVASLNVSDD